MRRLLAIVGVALCVAACGETRREAVLPVDASDDGPLSVFAVNYPLAWFAERIGGEHVRVHFPAPPDVDPAFWTPDAETVAAIDAGLRDGGPQEGFRRAADGLAARWRRTYTIHIAEYYALAEEWESALEWIEAAEEVRDANLPVIGSLPAFWPLHDDPRFRAVVERLGLPLQQGQPG